MRRHGETWMPGIDALPNDGEGRVGDGPPLGGAAWRAACGLFPPDNLHRAQLSAVFPGYPKSDPDESDASQRFRRNRGAAHLDGLLPIGQDRRRHLREAHAWILGIALSEVTSGTAPLVVWEGSHRTIRATFEQAFKDEPPEKWAEIDLTEIYQAARRQVFQSCVRRPVPLSPGGSVLLHRHLIHGVAPWQSQTHPDPMGRVIAYFQPDFSRASDWLDKP